ncbi:M16 family metallopeptidase [Dokdonella sp. MW10]|uniref:M16 family metallopeptidase n=1 Tax=Dokdonella sp. MW10 TaxID=2992926 RepID=UPI003F7DFB8B
MNRIASRFLAAAVASCLPLATLAATPVNPEGLPPFAADKPLPVPAIEKKTLANGLVVWVLPRQGGNPRVDLVLAVRGGDGADEARLPGLQNLMARLLDEGTKTRTAAQVAEELQGLGGSLRAGAGADGITVSASALASHAPALVALLADVARQPAFAAKEVTLAKANALQELKAAEAEPDYQAARALDRVLYGDHAYARMHATEASLAAMDRDALVAAHASRFRPDRSLLVIAGRLDAKAAFALAETSFGSWKGQGEALPDLPRTLPDRPVQRVFVERAGSVQSAIRFGQPGFAAGDKDEFAAAIANTITGGGFASRLFDSLREDKGYTYGAYSAFTILRAGGAFTAEADVRNEVTGAAVGEFQTQFRKLVEEPVGADELERAKRATAGRYLFRNQLQGAVAASLANNWLLGRGPEYLGEFVPKAREVTAEQVQTIAKRWFDPNKLSIVVVGDKAVAPQLEPYGEFAAKPK